MIGFVLKPSNLIRISGGRAAIKSGSSNGDSKLRVSAPPRKKTNMKGLLAVGHLLRVSAPLDVCANAKSLKPAKETPRLLAQ